MLNTVKKAVTYFLVIMLLCCMFFAQDAASQDFRKPPIVLQTAQIMPQGLLTGPNYTIKENVMNDGLTNIYELDTKYGPLSVESTVLLLKRIQELRALYRMEQLKGTDVFSNAAKTAASSPLSTAKGAVEDPVGTAKQVGSGISSFFSRVGAAVTSSDPYQAGALQSALGQAANKREFAFEFGVDPYSSYKPLQEALDSIAWTATGGSLTVKAAFSAIPGGAGAVVSVTSTADSLRSIVRDKTPAELKQINSEKLSAMGVPDSLSSLFLNNAYFDPLEQTLLVGELASMKGVRDRMFFIAVAASANTEAVATYLRGTAQIVSLYHQKVRPVERFVEANGTPFVRTKDGNIVGIFLLDYVFWTEGLEQKERAVSDAIRKMKGVKGKEILIGGAMDASAKKALESRGWKVTDRFAAKLFKDLELKK